MSRKRKTKKMETVLFRATFTLLKNRPVWLTYAELSDKTGIPEAWIKSFGQGRMTDPSVVRVEKLYNVLAEAPLELPDEL